MKHAAIICAAVIVALVSGISLWNSARIDSNNERALAQDRGTEFRLCTRIDVTRAVSYLHENTSEHEPLLPLLDCRPNLHGRPAVKLSSAAAAALARQIAARGFTP